MNISMNYSKYRGILSDIIRTGRYCDFKEIEPDTSFIVLRHDVDFSPERALIMGTIEALMGIKSSYYFQLTNNYYNSLSKKNLEIIEELKSMGHYIGIHYHLNGKKDHLEIKKDIENEIYIFSLKANIKPDRFSIHRPTPEVLKNEIVIPGVINTYGNLYFTFTDNYSDSIQMNVKYIADSANKWKYGYPSRENLNKHSKIQLLIHPCTWSEEGYDDLENFRSLIREKNSEMLETIDSECEHFGLVKDLL